MADSQQLRDAATAARQPEPVDQEPAEPTGWWHKAGDRLLDALTAEWPSVAHWIVVTAIVVAAVGVLVLAAGPLGAGAYGVLDDAARVQAVNGSRTVFVAALTALAALATWLINSAKFTHELQLSRLDRAAANDRVAYERFGAAAVQIASSGSASLRCAGLTAMHAAVLAATDAQAELRQQAMSIVAAHIRESAALDEAEYRRRRAAIDDGGRVDGSDFSPPDLQAAFTVLSQLRDLGPTVDLFLPAISVVGVNLSGCNLSSAHLELAAIHSGCEGAHFNGASLVGTIFYSCNLNGAHFIGADLSLALFASCDLHGADFSGAHVSEQTIILADGQRITWEDLGYRRAGERSVKFIGKQWTLELVSGPKNA